MKNIWFVITGFLIWLIQTSISLYTYLYMRVNPVIFTFRIIYFIGFIFIFIWILSCIRTIYSDRESLPFNITVITSLIAGLIFTMVIQLFLPDKIQARNLLLLIYSLMSFVIAVFETRLYYTTIQPFTRTLEDYNILTLPLFCGGACVTNIFVPAIIVVLSALKLSPRLLLLVLDGTYILHITFCVIYSMLSDAIDKIMIREEGQILEETPYLDSEEKPYDIINTYSEDKNKD